MNERVLCTLVEGDYFYGAAALLNSLVKAEYRGSFYVGYRGKLAAWCQNAEVLSTLSQCGTDCVFEQQDTPLHFTHYKQTYMNCLIKRGIVTDKLWYFDPDITVRCNWEFFDEWVGRGICACMEATDPIKPRTHPTRLAWLERSHADGWGEPVNPLDFYYNAGFIGLTVRNAGFLNLWEKGIALAGREVDQRIFMTTRRNPWFNDQDAFNLALMYWNGAQSMTGPEGMGFTPGGFIMYHASQGIKPWRKPFFKAALRGIPPSNADKDFLKNCAGPIEVFPKSVLSGKRRAAKAAAVIGRFYKRG